MEVRTEVQNADMVDIHELCNRVIGEVLKSQSANTQKYKLADKGRLRIFLSGIRFIADNASGIGNEIDLPKTDPRGYSLETNPEIFLVRNNMVNHVVRLLRLIRDEAVYSPSADDSSGFQNDDHKRLKGNVQRLENYLKNVVDVMAPMPFLETAPKRELQGHGVGDAPN